MALTDNITHYWKLDTDADDSVGADDGAITGATSVAAKINNGYDFDAVGEKIEFSPNEITIKKAYEQTR